MSAVKITVQATVAADAKKVRDYYTLPEHITKWNFASDDWQCPAAENDMRIDGKYTARMEAKDGSWGFDFEATNTEITDGKSFTYVMNERNVTVSFDAKGNSTLVTVIFDAETENPVEMQQHGWQAILDNFNKYTENN